MRTEYALLVGDIGATNARFSMVSPSGELSWKRVYNTADFSGLSAAIAEYTRSIGVNLPSCACLAVAAPVYGDRIEFTNNPWSFSISALNNSLHLEDLLVINDFEALARSIPTLHATSLFSVGAVESDPGGNKVVVGPGSGFGVAGLTRTTRGWRPIVGEGGYVDLAPKTDYELAIWSSLATRFGRVSAERVLSGQGLQELFRAVNEVNGTEMSGSVFADNDGHCTYSPAEILHLGIERKCSACISCLELFCAFLGDAAGNAALTFGARGGVYLGGGILPRMLDFLNGSHFRSRFESKGRMENYMKGIATHVITAELPALAGCINAFSNWQERR